MNEDDRDLDLQAWFAHAEEDLPSATFLALLRDEMIARERIRRRSRGLGGAAALLAAAWLVFSQYALLGSVARLLTSAVVDVEPGRWAALIAPLDQRAVLVGAAILAVSFVFRRIFS